MLQRNDPNSRIGLPDLSNTPGTAYVAVNQNGKFHQFRQYNDDRIPKLDIDYGIDTPLTGKDRRAIHIHEYVDGARGKGRFLTDEEYENTRNTSWESRNNEGYVTRGIQGDPCRGLGD